MKLSIVISASLALLTFTQCASDKAVFYQEAVSNSFSYDTGLGVVAYTPASTKKENKLLSLGLDAECAKTKAYEVSNVKMKRNLPNKCYAQTIKFDDVVARYQNDTLHIELSAINRRTKRVLKTISIEVSDHTYTTEVKHGRGRIEEVYDNRGKMTYRPVKKSNIRKDRISLNRQYYNVGDTIFGKVKIDAIMLDRMGRPTSELVKGEFRTIVVDNIKDCVVK